MSKHLESILKNIPPATVAQENFVPSEALLLKKDKVPEPTERLVAIVPRTLKEEIRAHVKSHKGETEKTVILRALKAIGFNVPEDWLSDKRSLR